MEIWQKSDSQQIQRLEAQIAKLRALKEATGRKEKTKHRRLETKRKILLGALLLQWMAEDKNLKTRVVAALETFLTRPSDRKAFGLQVTESRNAKARDEEQRTETEMRAEASADVA